MLILHWRLLADTGQQQPESSMVMTCRASKALEGKRNGKAPLYRAQSKDDPKSKPGPSKLAARHAMKQKGSLPHTEVSSEPFWTVRLPLSDILFHSQKGLHVLYSDDRLSDCGANSLSAGKEKSKSAARRRGVPAALEATPDAKQGSLLSSAPQNFLQLNHRV